MQIKTVLITVTALSGLGLALWFGFEPIFKTWKKRGFILFIIAIWMALVVLQIEIMSIFRILKQPWFEIFWLIFIALVWSVSIYHIVRKKYFLKVPLLWLWLKQKLNLKMDFFLWIFLGLISIYLVTLAMIAYVYPPTNYDSMVYHLPRILHWSQNQSVAPYATSIVRQVQMQPLAEFLLLYIHFLSNADRLFNFIQLGCFIICLMGLSLIASELGLNRKRQQAVLLLGLSIPMAIMQSTSTQNDLVAAAHLISFVAAGFVLLRMPDKAKAIWVGLSLGLALLTKGTSYVFSLPFILMIIILLFIHHRKSSIHILLMVGAMVLLVNMGHYIRVFSVFGTPLGPTSEYSNEWISLQGTASNILRTIDLNYIPARDQYDKPIDPRWYVRNWLKILHTFTGASPKDGRITWPNSTPNAFELVISNPGEDHIGAPWHTGLIIITAPLLFLSRNAKNTTKKILVGYFLCLVAASLAYCSLMRWQEWANRLLLPLLLLWMPLVVAVLRTDQWKLELAIPTILAILSLTFVIKTPQRPLYPDTFNNMDRDTYSLTLNSTYQPFINIAREITDRGCNQVGLLFGVNTWEYPLWQQLESRGFTGQIEHIYVENPTAKYSNLDFEPCAIVEFDKRTGAPDHWQQLRYDQLTLYLRP